MQKGRNTALVVCEAGCNTGTGTVSFKSTNLVKAISRRSLIEIGQRCALTSPRGTATTRPDYFKDVVHAKKIVRKDDDTSTEWIERQLRCVDPIRGPIRTIERPVENEWRALGLALRTSGRECVVVSIGAQDTSAYGRASRSECHQSSSRVRPRNMGIGIRHTSRTQFSQCRVRTICHPIC